MPLVGQRKEDNNFVSYRAKQQTQRYPAVVKRADRIANGRRYKSETLSYSDLWVLYLTGKLKPQNDEDELRGAKSKGPKDETIEPIKVRSLPGRFSDDGYLDFHNWLRARDQSRKDLFWFAGQVLKNNLMMPATHQIVCDQFLQKDFDGTYILGYRLTDFQAALAKQNRVPRDWDSKKRKYVPRLSEIDKPDNFARDAMILDPRGFLKSTLNAMDCVQLIINCPDIRILIIAGEFKLSVGFMLAVKEHFYLARGGEPKPFHCLFPEFVLRGVDGTSKEPFTTPARVHEQARFPTLWTNSIEAAVSGWHCDIRKCDDVVTNTNCNTSTTREFLKHQIDGSKNLLDEWGWSDYIGTRYFPDDYYGTRIEQYEKEPDDSNLKLFSRKCWIVKPEFTDVPLRQIKEEMVWLTFPEKATFKSLRLKLLENEKSFRCQQLNEPVGDQVDPFRVQFTEAGLRDHLVAPTTFDRIPGEIFILWDWALTANKRSDYSAGVVIKVYDKNGKKAVAVLEVVFNKWTQTELALQIVLLNKKWNPKRTLIENSPGSEYLKMEISRATQRVGMTLFDIFWKPVSLQDNAKRNRIKGLETLLTNERLYFVLGPWIDETFDQMIKYTGEKKNKGRKDDIPDAMSNILFYLPIEFQNPLEAEIARRMEEEEWNKTMLRAQHKRIFGDGSQNVPPPPVAQPQSPSPYGNITSKLFGNNGLRA